MGKLTKNLILFTLSVLLTAICVSCGTSSKDMGIRNEADFAFEWISYTVQQGETSSNIAEQFGVSLSVVIVCNDIHDAWNLQKGTILRIPNMDGLIHTVKAKDTIAKISVTYQVPEENIRYANDIEGYTLKEGQALFIPGANKMAARSD